jgi:hypothetical protein
MRERLTVLSLISGLCRRSNPLDGILRAPSFVRLLIILFTVSELCSPCTSTGSNPLTSAVKVFLKSKYIEKDEIKALGALWDKERKKWFVPPGKRLAAFSKWIPDYIHNTTPAIYASV